MKKIMFIIAISMFCTMSIATAQTHVSAKIEIPTMPVLYGNEGRLQMTMTTGIRSFGIKGIFSNSFTSTAYVWAGEEIIPKLTLGVGCGNTYFRATENKPASLEKGVVVILNSSLFKDQVQIQSVFIPTHDRFGYDIQLSMPAGSNFEIGLRFKDNAVYPYVEWTKMIKKLRFGALASWYGISLVAKF